MENRIIISIIVPLYNEESILHATHNRLMDVLESINETYEIIYINDGSHDKTSVILNDICVENGNVKIIEFSRNFGHQTAITAGMDYSQGKCVVIIDGDLQDPPEVIPQMMEKWREGYEVVYGKRISRQNETFLKKFSAKIFYRLLRKLTDVDIPVDVGDFRLIDKSVCDILTSLRERHRYVRGLVSWVGFNQTYIEYKREGRNAGKTKYPYRKMLGLAFDGITSFSHKPLKFASYIGTFISCISFFYLIIVLIQRIFIPESTEAGWASILAVSLFFNGIVLLFLGIIGDYIGRVYDETKNRPLYIVKREKNVK